MSGPPPTVCDAHVYTLRLPNTSALLALCAQAQFGHHLTHCCWAYPGHIIIICQCASTEGKHALPGAAVWRWRARRPWRGRHRQRRRRRRQQQQGRSGNNESAACSAPALPSGGSIHAGQGYIYASTGLIDIRLTTLGGHGEGRGGGGTRQQGWVGGGSVHSPPRDSTP